MLYAAEIASALEHLHDKKVACLDPLAYQPYTYLKVDLLLTAYTTFT